MLLSYLVETSADIRFPHAVQKGCINYFPAEVLTAGRNVLSTSQRQQEPEGVFKAYCPPQLQRHQRREETRPQPHLGDTRQTGRPERKLTRLDIKLRSNEANQQQLWKSAEQPRWSKLIAATAHSSKAPDRPLLAEGLLTDTERDDLGHNKKRRHFLWAAS